MSSDRQQIQRIVEEEPTARGWERLCQAVEKMPTEEVGAILPGVLETLRRWPPALRLFTRYLPEHPLWSVVSSLRVWGSDSQALAGLGKAQDLTELAIYSFAGATLESLPALAGLQRLSLFNAMKLRSLRGVESFSSLAELNISSAPAIKDLSGLGRMEGLRGLRITACRDLRSVEGIGGASTIERAVFSGCPVLVDLRDLARCPKLQALDLGSSSSLTSLEGIEGLEEIRALDLQYTSISDLRALEGLECLEVLDLSENKALRSLGGIGKKPILRDLRLRGCVQIRALEELRGFRELRRLDISGCKGLSSLDDLAGLPELRECVAEECVGLEGVQEIRALPKLQGLSLAHCANLTGVEIDGLPEIVRLRLSFCRRLEVLRFADSPWLTTLLLDHCTKFRSLSGLRGLGRIKKISLVGCLFLSDLSLLFGSQGLEEVDLRGCLSLERLDGLASLPRLGRLCLEGCDKLEVLPQTPRLDTRSEVEAYQAAIRPLQEGRASFQRWLLVSLLEERRRDLRQRQEEEALEAQLF